MAIGIFSNTWVQVLKYLVLWCESYSQFKMPSKHVFANFSKYALWIIWKNAKIDLWYENALFKKNKYISQISVTSPSLCNSS